MPTVHWVLTILALTFVYFIFSTRIFYQCFQHMQRYVSIGYAHNHDDVIKWKHFPRNWPFVREIHRSPVNFPHKGQWRGALMFSLIYAWINDWVNNREAGDLRRQHGHYDVIVMNACLVVLCCGLLLDECIASFGMLSGTDRKQSYRWLSARLQ